MRFLGADVLYGVFADWQTARVRPETKATLGMLAKLSRQPLQFEPEDMKPSLNPRIPPEGIEQAVVVGSYISNYSR